MAEKISITKGFDDDAFDTYVPELSDNADIQNALELFYYGNSEDGNATGDVSLHANLVDFDARITANDSDISGHTGAISDVHGVGAGNSIVGTGTVQTLTNKTLTSPKINENVSLTATSTELNYVDGVTSSIQTQIDTNTPTGMIAPYSGSVSPTGWLLCDGSSYSTTTYANLFSIIGYTFGGTSGSFNVPNLKGRVVVGIDAAQTQFDTRGETGGGMTHQHAASNSGNTSIAHNHTIPVISGNADSSGAHEHNTNLHSHTTNNHSHGLNVPANSGDTNLNHTHSFSDTSGGANAQATTISGSYSYSFTSPSPTTYRFHTHSVGGTTGSTNLNHTHSVGGNVDAVANLNTNNAAPTAVSGGAHTHTVSNIASVTADGAGGSHTHTTPVSDALSNLQPYMALNYIIKF